MGRREVRRPVPWSERQTELVTPVRSPIRSPSTLLTSLQPHDSHLLLHPLTCFTGRFHGIPAKDTTLMFLPTRALNFRTSLFDRIHHNLCVGSMATATTSAIEEFSEAELHFQSCDPRSRDAHEADSDGSRTPAEGYGRGGSPATDAKVSEEDKPATKRKSEITLTDQTNLLPFKRVLAVFGGLSLCALVSCLDSTIVATALPRISAAFNAGSVSSWVPSAYLLTSTAFQPLCTSYRC